MESTWFQGATIERKDVNGDYEPQNCTWLKKTEQQQNRRDSLIIDTPWGRMNASYAAAKIGLGSTAMYDRIKNWPKERWFDPPGKSGPKR